ncbi:MAG: hypothetical protein RLZZ536_2725, partial [Planctomycetota bacterium]
FVGDTKGTTDTADDIGVSFSGGTLLGYIAPDGTYAFNASGAAKLDGVSDLTLSGTLSAQKNTTGAAVQKSITVGGVTTTLEVAKDLSRVGGSVTLTTPIANLSADFAVETTGTSPNREVVFGATNVSTFVGDTKGTTDTTDDVGVSFSGATLVGYIAPDGKYAFSASGNAALAGVDGLTLSGTLSARRNTTGTNVSREFNVDGQTLPLNVNAGVSGIRGTNVTLGTPLGSFTGNFLAENQTTASGTELILGVTGISGLLGSANGPGEADDTGIRYSDGTLIVYTNGSGKYAIDAEASMSLAGVTGLSVSGKLRFERNETGADVQKTISIGAGGEQVTRSFNQPAGTNRRSGTNLAFKAAGLLDFSGDFTISDSTDGDALLIGGSNIQAFVGRGADTAETTDDLGIRLSNISFGVVLYTQTSAAGRYAMSASGTASLVGLYGLSLTATLDVKQNSTGQAVNYTVPAGNTSVTVSYETGTNIRKVTGPAQISAADIFQIGGTLTASITRSGDVALDFPDLTLAIRQGNDSVFGIDGGARFLISQADGFRMVDFGVDSFSVYGVKLNTTAGSMPDFTAPVDGVTSSSFGGSWTGGTSSSEAGVAVAGLIGDAMDLSILNKQKYIDIDFYPPSGTTLDLASITDAAPEFTFSGSALGDVSIDKVEYLSGRRFRYFLKDSNTSNNVNLFTSGSLTLQFEAGSWGTTNSLLAPSSTLTLSLTDGSAAGQTGSKMTAGPLSITAPTIGIEDLQFKLKPDAAIIPETATVLITVGIGAAEASLNIGSQSQQDNAGLGISLTDILATFDISLDLNIPAILGSSDQPKIRSGGITGAFTLDVGSLDLNLAEILTVAATDISVKYNPDKDADGDGTVSNAENTAWKNSEIVAVQTADITFTPLDATGSLDPLQRSDGTTIPGLSIRNSGLTLGTASVTKYGPFEFGTALRISDVTAGVTDLSFSFDGDTSFDGDVFIASSSAELFPGKSFSATIVDGTEDADTYAVKATVDFENGEFQGFQFNADELDIQLGTYLSVNAKNLLIDTTATATEELVSFDKLGATLTVGGLALG